MFCFSLLSDFSHSKLTTQAQRDYDAPFTNIPGHGRYQHFGVGGRDRIAHLLATWADEVDNTEKCKRLIDLFLVSVLLDAGAGTKWSYKSSENGRVYRRSEGIAVATLEMFKTVRQLSLHVCFQHNLISVVGILLWQQQQQISGRQRGFTAIDCGETCPGLTVKTWE